MRNYFYLAIAMSAFWIFAGNTYSQSKTFTVTTPRVERVWNPAMKGKPEFVLEDLEHKLSDATRVGDKRILENLLADEIMILGVSYTKEQWIQLLVSGKGTFLNYEKRIHRIRIRNDTAIVTGLQIVDSKTGTGLSSYQFNFMSTWIKSSDGTWECVAIAGDQVKSRI